MIKTLECSGGLANRPFPVVLKTGADTSYQQAIPDFRVACMVCATIVSLYFLAKQFLSGIFIWPVTPGSDQPIC
jgi:hypothetical protein